MKNKYFVLEPEGNTPEAEASRAAMLEYAKKIEETNKCLTRELRLWVAHENLKLKEDKLPRKEDSPVSLTVLVKKIDGKKVKGYYSFWDKRWRNDDEFTKCIYDVIDWEEIKK